MAAGNIRRQGFGEIWAHSPVFQRLRGLRVADYQQCAPCPHNRHCARDRGAESVVREQVEFWDDLLQVCPGLLHRFVDRDVVLLRVRLDSLHDFA